MKTLIAALILVSLSGCAFGPNRMSNDMVIAEAMKCEQANLPWRQSINYDGSVSNVYCTPHQYGRRPEQ